MLRYLRLRKEKKGDIALTGAGTDGELRQADKGNQQRTFKICALFTDCISEIKNT